jgi:GT2 family glycosyltransferase
LPEEAKTRNTTTSPKKPTKKKGAEVIVMGKVASGSPTKPASMSVEDESANNLLREKITKLEGKLHALEKRAMEKERLAIELTFDKVHLENTIRAIHGSTSWRITAPIRFFKTHIGGIIFRLRFFRISLIKYYSIVAWNILKSEGPVCLVKRASKKLLQTQVAITEYQRWIAEHDTISESQRQVMRTSMAQFQNQPLISIVMPVYNVDGVWLRHALDSVIGQIYPNWELCIADDNSSEKHIAKILKEYQEKDSRIKVVFRKTNGHISESTNSALEVATGEFVGLLDHDDMLTEHALFHVVKLLNEAPQVDLIYSDEDKVDEHNRRFSPYFKSGWNPDMLLTNNYFCHFGVYRKTLIDKVGGLRKGYEGSQDYDLILRCSKLTSDDKIRHIPKILYHWRAIEGSTARQASHKSYTINASLSALNYHLSGTGAVAKEGAIPNNFRVIWSLPRPEPMVSIIIPTRNQLDLLKTCISSIFAKTSYANYEVVVVDNQSDDEKTLQYLNELAEQNKIKLLKYNKVFNFSAINNFAASKADGEVLCFLNNDIEVLSPEWLREMVSQAMRPEIGAVGAKLYYPNMLVQHGGVLLGGGSPNDAVAGHLLHGLSRNDPGYYGRAFNVHNVSAVTAACMVMRKSIFDEVDGFDAKNLAVAFNDVDLCIRVGQAGYRILLSPHAEMIHHESASRGYDIDGAKQKRFKKEVEYMRETYAEILDNDPYYNPNLNPFRGDFSLAWPPKLLK